MSTKSILDEKMDSLRIADGLDAIFEIFRRCNKYIDETMPWVLSKDDTKRDRLATVLYHLVESIRIGAVLLQAFMPDTAEKIFRQLNTDLIGIDTINEFGQYKSGTKLGNAEPLFMRIDNKK